MAVSELAPVSATRPPLAPGWARVIMGTAVGAALGAALLHTGTPPIGRLLHENLAFDTLVPAAASAVADLGRRRGLPRVKLALAMGLCAGLVSLALQAYAMARGGTVRGDAEFMAIIVFGAPLLRAYANQPKDRNSSAARRKLSPVTAALFVGGCLAIGAIVFIGERLHLVGDVVGGLHGGILTALFVNADRHVVTDRPEPVE
jgi:hypothetical protein